MAQARTADIADGELRRRGGFLVTARHTRGTRGRGASGTCELADGHAQYRFSGYVTVTAGVDGPAAEARAPRWSRPPARPASSSASSTASRTWPSPAPSRWAGGCRDGRSRPRVPAHVATTRHLCAAYPLVSEAGLGHQGVLIGRDVLGGSFVYDPFALYRQGVVTNPNMVVFGQIGRGKSSFVKSYLWRQAVFGRHAWVVDPKGEYGPLAGPGAWRRCALRPGGAVRLNPLDTPAIDVGLQAG